MLIYPTLKLSPLQGMAGMGGGVVNRSTMGAGGVPGGGLYSFTTFTFTSASTSGNTGPSLSSLQSAYSGAAFLSSYFTSSNGIQLWTAPKDGTYEIELRGASGGGNTTGSYFPADPGQGAKIVTRVSLTKSTQYSLVVGQTPGGSSSDNGSAGGGGSWMYTGSIGGNGLIAVAGGGGGWGHGTSSGTGGNGLGGNASQASRRVSSGANVSGKTGNGTGTNNGTGYGGGLSTTGDYGGASGGAGWLSDGSDRTSGNTSTGGHSAGSGASTAWLGGTGGNSALNGGFGGGGGSNGSGHAGGGGGGYTGGPAGNDWNNQTWGNGGGGGSYYTGSLQASSDGAHGGSHTQAQATNGYIKITFIS